MTMGSRIPKFAGASLLLILSACGGGDETAEQLEDAAGQSDPAAATVLNNTAEALREQEGPAPPGAAQDALERAGEAQVQQNSQFSSTLRAEPNLPNDPNRPPADQPPEKMDVSRNASGSAE